MWKKGNPEINGMYHWCGLDHNGRVTSGNNWYENGKWGCNTSFKPLYYLPVPEELVNMAIETRKQKAIKSGEYAIIKYDIDGGNSLTQCKYYKSKVGSCGCNACGCNLKTDEAKQEVYCNYDNLYKRNK
jgi:hypothetical protein